MRPADPRCTLAVAAAGTLLVLVAFTTPLTTLVSTAAGLGAGPGAQAWVLSAMNVGTAAGLLSSGAIGDDYGRRRTFIAGALLLAGSSMLGALALNALVLILARVLQGLGGAAMLACGLGLIGHAFPEGPAQVRATGVWGASLGAGVAVGPILAAGLAALGEADEKRTLWRIEAAPCLDSSKVDAPANLSSPSPYPYIEVGW